VFALLIAPYSQCTNTCNKRCEAAHLNEPPVGSEAKTALSLISRYLGLRRRVQTLQLLCLAPAALARLLWLWLTVGGGGSWGERGMR
jgi:hypothetical protein